MVATLKKIIIGSQNAFLFFDLIVQVSTTKKGGINMFMSEFFPLTLLPVPLVASIIVTWILWNVAFWP